MNPLPTDVVRVEIDRVWSHADELLGTRFTTRERDAFERLRVDKRRRDWLAGRLAAKRAVQLRLGLPQRRIEILRTPEGPQRGRPVARIDGERAIAGSISISHSGGLAVACHATTDVGIDIEVCEPRDESFISTAFTADEARALLDLGEAERPDAVTLAWCRKEALAKSLGRGFGVALHTLRTDRTPRHWIEAGLFDHGGPMAWARVQKRAQP